MAIYKIKDEINYDAFILNLEKWNISKNLYAENKYNLTIETNDTKAMSILDGEINENFSQRMKSNDPAIWMLNDDFHSTPTSYNPNCYICCDPEFAQMGLPLCTSCYKCGAHVPADDSVCDNGHDQMDMDNPEFAEYVNGSENPMK
jgi:hypothetical protein